MKVSETGPRAESNESDFRHECVSNMELGTKIVKSFFFLSGIVKLIDGLC